ncbi:nucleolar and coiled-body phosphoprotein 1-like [Chenopodium quinoa]|uniref:nucleolar and coiled-body phosphoprotein 1-like n=1 Tax=Chenopodium quinoa TaxID=63459 RepID=UPI000B76BC66|nr:nucleolar and coiled-body phosphoprotein 1-like [Chenopodium quinoa]
MARTKQTTRRYRADGSFYHSDSETVNSYGSIRVPASEISKHPPNPSSDLPQTLTYYSSSSSSGTPSDTILREADNQYQTEPSEQALEESLGEDPAGPSQQSPSSGESSNDDSASSSSENASVTSEEARAKISTARESLSVEMGEDKAMEKVSATRKPVVVSAAKYRSNVLNRANDEQKTVGIPKSGSTKPSPSKQSQPKIQKTGAGDVRASGKNRKHISHKPKKGDGSTLEADREVSKPDATQASKGGFKQPSTVVGLAREKRRHGKEEEAMLRIQGLRRPIQEKSKEVTAAKARVESALDRAQFEIAQNELLTLDMMYSQADVNLQVKKDLDSARSKIIDLKAEIKGLKEKLEPLQEAKKEAERAKNRVGRLEVRLANQEKLLKSKFKSRAKKEKEALVKQMMKDYEAIMRMAWEAVQPGADYNTWKSKFD